MESWGVAFLGVIALSSVVQAAFLIGLAIHGRRLSRRLEELTNSIEREIRPSLEHVSRATRNLTEVSDLALLQARRVDDLVADTVEKVEEATSLLRRVTHRPLGPLVDIGAFFKGLHRGFAVYRSLRGVDAERRGSSRRYAEDEHLFI
jgi:hypothetical protein